jgi:hypothetical protein
MKRHVAVVAVVVSILGGDYEVVQGQQGFISCQCPSWAAGSCSTLNDCPDYPQCGVSGCYNSEGRSVDCEQVTIIGPARNCFTGRMILGRLLNRTHTNYCPVRSFCTRA